jgi:CRISPR-associated protein Cas2
MARRFFLVSYDISDDRCRTRVAKYLLDFGERLQYSVFCCQLNPRERVRLEEGLKQRIDQKADQILLLDAGAVEGQNPQPQLDYLGRVWRADPRVQIV